MRLLLDETVAELAFLDMVMIPVLFQDPRYRKEMTNLIAHLSRHDAIPFQILTKIITQMDPNAATKKEIETLETAFVNFGLHLLLSPIRDSWFPSIDTFRFYPNLCPKLEDEILNQSEGKHPMYHIIEFMLKLIPNLSEGPRCHYISALLTITSPADFIEPTILFSKSLGIEEKLTKMQKVLKTNVQNTEGNGTSKSARLIHSIKRILMSEKKTTILERDEIGTVYNVAIVASSMLVTLSQEERYRSGFRTFERTLVDRVYNFASRISKKTYDDELVTKEYRLFEFNCCMLVNLGQRSVLDSNMESEKSSSQYSAHSSLGKISLIDILQRLLICQSLPANSPQLDFNDVNKPETLASGLILAKYVFQSDYCSCEDQKAVLERVRGILLPSNGERVNPCTGYWGVIFYMSLYSGLEERKDNRFSLMSSELFNIIKSLLIQTGIIQLEDSVIKARQEEMKQKCNEGTDVLLYGQIPLYFDPQGSFRQRIKRKRMVFSISPLVRNQRLNVFKAESFNWNVLYIHTLMDAYLKLGRIRQNHKWSPIGWLLATIELPHKVTSFVEKNNERYDNASELIYDKSVLIQDTVTAQLQNGLSFSKDEVNGDIGHDNEEVFRISIEESVSSCVVSISLLFTILKHTNEHLHLKENKNEDVKEMKRLLKFHLAKMYDLRFRCIKMINALPDAAAFFDTTSCFTKYNCQQVILSRIIFSFSGWGMFLSLIPFILHVRFITSTMK